MIDSLINLLAGFGGGFSVNDLFAMLGLYKKKTKHKQNNFEMILWFFTGFSHLPSIQTIKLKSS